MTYKHVPVLLEEVIELLNPHAGGVFIDCTLGGAGYTMAIAKLIGEIGQVFSFDLDKMAIENAEENIKKEKLNNIKIINDNFRYLKKYIGDNNEESKEGFVDGIVFDLGLSSAQLEDERRGFSFLVDAPIDMAFDQSSENEEQATYDILNDYKQFKIEKILKDYGEERYAKAIAREIVIYRKQKKIERTKELVEIIEKAVPSSYKYNKKIHFATKTFQALRIATNDELGSLHDAIKDAVDVLKPGGRVVVVSFHSLEDRIVKQFFRQESKDCLCPPELPDCRCGHKARLKIINKKIIIASEKELANNPRARSAKLRVAEKI